MSLRKHRSEIREVSNDSLMGKLLDIVAFAVFVFAVMVMNSVGRKCSLLRLETFWSHYIKQRFPLHSVGKANASITTLILLKVLVQCCPCPLACEIASNILRSNTHFHSNRAHFTFLCFVAVKMDLQFLVIVFFFWFDVDSIAFLWVWEHHEGRSIPEKGWLWSHAA